MRTLTSLCVPAVLVFLAFTSLARAQEITSPAGVAHRFIAVDLETGLCAIVEPDGKISWQRKGGGMHDLHVLPDGHILMGDGFQRVIELVPGLNGAKDQIVWQYDSSRQNREDGKKVEIHAFQRLADGNTMIAESGPSRIIEVDKDGKLVHQIKLTVTKPSTHRDTRLARKLDNGHYLVCHEGDGVVREYDPDGAVVWEYAVPLFDKKPAGGHGPEAWGNQTFGVLRLPTGNTLIATGNGHSLLEVTPAKVIVWKLEQKELPGITLAWCTTLQVMPNGNVVFGNCHAGKDNPQIIEVTREKKLVWSYKDFKNFGNSTTNSQVLDGK